MLNKNINKTTIDQTVVPIYYIDDYKDNNIKQTISDYKFKEKTYNQYLLNELIDICIYSILENSKKNILFTSPPSTMYYRKEKGIDSMNNLLKLTSIYINDYFNMKSFDGHIFFYNLFKIKSKYLKENKAQHLNTDRKSRLYNKDKYIIRKTYKNDIKNSKIIIIDDISTTGSTLYLCQKSLNDLFSDLDIELFSLAH